MFNLKDFGDGDILISKTRGKIFKLSSYHKNPILTIKDLGISGGNAAVFNPGAEIYNNKIILAPRCHKDYKKVKFFDKEIGIERDALENYKSEIQFFESQDGNNYKQIKNIGLKSTQDFPYGIEDIRIIKNDERYFLIGCGKIGRPFFDRNSDRIAIYSTKDFTDIFYHGIIKSFDARSMIPFPEFVNSKLFALFRFFPNIHLDIIENSYSQLIEPNKYEKEWAEIYKRKDGNLFIKSGDYPHESEKIGPGPQLVKTNRGWLLFYYAIGTIEPDIAVLYGLSGSITRCYSLCCALLDLVDPRKIVCRTKTPIYIPSYPYELFGDETYSVDIPAVVFPTGIVKIENKLLLYCGAGDKYCIVLCCNLDNLLDYLCKYCRIQNH